MKKVIKTGIERITDAKEQVNQLRIGDTAPEVEMEIITPPAPSPVKPAAVLPEKRVQVSVGQYAQLDFDAEVDKRGKSKKGVQFSSNLTSVPSLSLDNANDTSKPSSSSVSSAPKAKTVPCTPSPVITTTAKKIANMGKAEAGAMVKEINDQYAATRAAKSVSRPVHSCITTCLMVRKHDPECYVVELPKRQQVLSFTSKRFKIDKTAELCLLKRMAHGNCYKSNKKANIHFVSRCLLINVVCAC